MKKHFSLSFAAAILVTLLSLLGSCSKDATPLGPAACITPLPSYVVIDTPLVFSSCSVNGTKYAWDFGDGKTGDSSVVKHTYPAPGSYTIKLTVTNSTGSNTAIFTLVVHNPVGRVKKTVETRTGSATTTSTYIYDTLGRLSSTTAGGNTTTYSYATGMVTVTQGGSPTVGMLNSLNLLASFANLNYTYGNNNFLTLTTDGSNTVSDTITGNNTSSIVQTVGTSTVTSTYTFTTDLDYRDFGLAFLGKPNENLIHTRTVSDGTTTVIYTYSYTFDSQTRVSKQTITSTGYTDVITYTYF